MIKERNITPNQKEAERLFLIDLAEILNKHDAGFLRAKKGVDFFVGLKTKSSMISFEQTGGFISHSTNVSILLESYGHDIAVNGQVVGNLK